MESTVRGKRRSNLHPTSYRRTAYGIDTDGHFKSQKVSLFRGIWIRYFIPRIFVVACKQCKFSYQVKARKSALKGYICERCRTYKDE